MTRHSSAGPTVDRGAVTPTSTIDGAAFPMDLGLAPLAWGSVSVVALAMFTVELLVADRYGFHRDELYFLACARHLAWGYVDQPPLVPAVARLVLVVFGPSVFWLRALSALAGAATVFVSTLTARELGGRRVAQVIASVAAATSPQALAAFHLLSTTAFDVFFWSMITWLVARMLRTGNRRIWVPIGLFTGIALLDKLNVLFLVLAILAGLALSTQRALLRSKWLAVGTALTLLLASPDIAWNATHQWAQLSMTHSLHQENSSLGASLAFIPLQFIRLSSGLFWPGCGCLAWRAAEGPSLQVIGRGIPAFTHSLRTVGRQVLLPGRHLLRPVRRRWRGHRRTTSSRPAVKARGSIRRRLGLMVVAAAITLPLTLPVLPEGMLASGPWEGSINKDLGRDGWVASACHTGGRGRRSLAEQRTLEAGGLHGRLRRRPAPLISMDRPMVFPKPSAVITPTGGGVRGTLRTGPQRSPSASHAAICLPYSARSATKVRSRPPRVCGPKNVVIRFGSALTNAGAGRQRGSRLATMTEATARPNDLGR